MKLDTYISRLTSASNDLTNFIFKDLKSREAYVLAVPKRRLGVSGTDANDQQINPLYAESTIRRKKKKGQSTRHVTLKDTGNLYSTFKLVKENSAIDFRAPATKKSRGLVEHYDSNELFGLSPKDNEEIYRIFIKPTLEELLEGDGIIDLNDLL